MNALAAWIRAHRNVSIIIGVAALLFVVGGISSASHHAKKPAASSSGPQTSPSETPTQSNGFPPDVVANAQHLMSEDGSSDIASYEVAFYRWSSSCQEGASSAGEIDTAYADLQRHGLATTRLKLMRTVANNAFTQTSGENCAGDLAAYLVLAEQ